MTGETGPDLLERAEEEARKVPPLRGVLFMLMLVFGPYFITALAMAAIDGVAGPASDGFYAIAAAVAALGMIAGLIGAAVWWGRYVAGGFAARPAEKVRAGAFQSGFGLVAVYWRQWYTAAAGLAGMAYVVLRTWGDDDASRDRFWEMSREVGILAGGILVFVAVCIRLGRRVQKQRSAR